MRLLKQDEQGCEKFQGSLAYKSEIEVRWPHSYFLTK
jgi:hypothetical protein